MSKFDYAEKIKHASHFEMGDIPSGADFAAFIAACQAGIQEHEHVATGGEGTETGDAAPIYDLEDGADFHGQEAKNLVIHQGTEFPQNPTQGQEFYRTDHQKVYIYNGSAWVVEGAAWQVPPGAICLFKSSCPTGWSRVAELDGKFPRGAESYGGTGGGQEHKHSFASAGYDNHQCERSVSEGNCCVYGYYSDYKTEGKTPLPPYVTFVFCQKD